MKLASSLPAHSSTFVLPFDLCRAPRQILTRMAGDLSPWLKRYRPLPDSMVVMCKVPMDIQW
jgi:hypothetical protein